MKKFTYVEYNSSICILINDTEYRATIAGIGMPSQSDSFYIYEIEVPIEDIKQTNIEVFPSSMLYRLREYRMSHRDIFGFVEEELSLIHSFL